MGDSPDGRRTASVSRVGERVTPSPLTDKDGKLYDRMTVDKLHLSLKGCQVWADVLKPLLTELLGSPAQEDHAPPPAGDPSAKAKPPAAG